jgi:hypothetical protein
VIIELSGGYGKAVMVELEHLRDLLRADYNGERRGPKGQDWTDFLSTARPYIYRRPDSPASAGYVLNWLTTQDNKNQIFNELRDSHISGALVINSRPTLEEMMTIVQEGDSIGAPGHQKDDRTFALALANHAWVQDERPAMMAQGHTYASVTARENGDRTGGHVIDRIVAEHFRRYEAGITEEPMETLWQRDVGLV